MDTDEIYDKEYMIKFYRDNCFSLNYRTFPEVKRTIFRYMKTDYENKSSELNILFGEWLFTKIYMNYKVDECTRNDIIPNMIKSIEDVTRVVHKTVYTRYHDVITMSLICKHFFHHRFNDDRYFLSQLLNDTNLIDNHLRDPEFEFENMRRHFIDWTMATDNYEEQSNLLDVLLRRFNCEEVREIYNRLRYEINRHNFVVRNNKINSKTIYDDRQNVHDSDIHSGSVNQCACLVNDMKPYIQQLIDDGVTDINAYLKNMFINMIGDKIQDKGNKYSIDTVYERCIVDNTFFTGVINKSRHKLDPCRTKSDTAEGGPPPRPQVEPDTITYRIYDVMTALLIYINNKSDQEVKKSLCEVLLLEMNQMAGFCTSGYITRFINTLRGFDERYDVNISSYKQFNARLIKIIETAVEKSRDDDILLGSISDVGSYEHNKYINFIIVTVNANMTSLIREYGINDVYVYISNILNDILNINVTVTKQQSNDNDYTIIVSNPNEEVVDERDSEDDSIISKLKKIFW